MGVYIIRRIFTFFSVFKALFMLLFLTAFHIVLNCLCGCNSQIKVIFLILYTKNNIAQRKIFCLACLLEFLLNDMSTLVGHLCCLSGREKREI